mmetsp:Transcript_53430/g.173842  ORF Transcript_53430/g.173842 Transcript_53430/m.173842 type:complete len:597 (-) Transcript_53430:2041-3831(-)
MGLLQLREHRGTSYVKVHRSAAEPDFGAEASSGEVLQVARKHLGAGPQAGCVLLAEPVDSNCDWMHWSSALSTAQRQPKSRRLLMRLTRQPLGRNGTGNGVNAREVQCLRPLDLRIGPEGRCDGSRFALRHSACLVQHNERLLASRGPALEHGRVPHQAVVPATGHAHGHGDGGGRGQAHRAGAGEHHDGEAELQREADLERRVLRGILDVAREEEEQPHRSGGQAEQEDTGHKARREVVGQALDARLAALCAGHELCEPSQSCGGANGSHGHDDIAAGKRRACQAARCRRPRRGARQLLHGRGLARDQGLVGGAAALNDDALRGEAGADGDAAAVAELQQLQGHLLEAAAVFGESDHGGGRLGGQKLLQRGGSALPGPELQLLATEDHQQQHRGHRQKVCSASSKLGEHRAIGVSEAQDGEPESVDGRDTSGRSDQDVHREGVVLQCLGGTVQEVAAGAASKGRPGCDDGDHDEHTGAEPMRGRLVVHLQPHVRRRHHHCEHQEGDDRRCDRTLKRQANLQLVLLCPRAVCQNAQRRRHRRHAKIATCIHEACQKHASTHLPGIVGDAQETWGVGARGHQLHIHEAIATCGSEGL